MKREEAKKVLENLKEHTLNYQSGLALDMGISALSEIKSEWYPITYRPMTEDELKDYKGSIYLGEEIMILDCCLPDSGAEVLITANGYVGIDTFYNEDGDCYFESANIDEVTAWRPLPEPYNPNKESEGDL